MSDIRTTFDGALLSFELGIGKDRMLNSPNFIYIYFGLNIFRFTDITYS